MGKGKTMPRNSSQPRPFSWELFFLLFTALGFLSFSYRYLDDLARGHEGTLARRLLEEGTGVYSVLVLLPLVLRFAQAQQLAAAKLQTELAQAQLENLRLQLQPHFLFNTLNTISSVMYEDVRAADAMITQLGDLLRLTLQASRTHEIPLAEELEIARLYLDLMQKRFENKLQVSYAIDPSLNDTLVPQLVLQPLLENSLRHGMKSGNGPIELSVAAHREDGSLDLQVLDSGCGLGETDSSAIFGRGVGLSNIRDRLAHLYGDRQQFLISNRPSGGAEVTLRVPLHTSAQISQAS